ncbi:dihydropteroate synthase [Halobacteriaceae archaeon GCM10025711]
MEYHEAASYLHSLKHLRPKLGTETTAAMLEFLGDPHEGVSYVQVAGSNGKGSTARMVEQVLREAGFDVGLYTSPDLNDFRERVTVNGRKISRQEVAAFASAIRPCVTRRAVAGDAPTFFEVTTVMALQHFGNRDVDVAVLEVGIGGRYDATSVVDPVASAVTSVSLEHTDIIGETVEEIARDKAQVAPGDRPLVTGTSGAAIDAIRDETDVVTVGEEDADVLVAEGGLASVAETAVSVTGPDWHVETSLPLLGAHQAANAGVAATLARQVAAVDERTIATGLRKASWPGRVEVMGRDPLVVLDGAHNPDASAKLAGVLARFDYDDLHLVFGAMRDKDHVRMREALPTPDTVAVCRPDVDRAENPDTLAALFEAGDAGAVTTRSSVLDATEAVIDRAEPDDLVLVTGSLRMVAEARDRWTRTPVAKRVDSREDACTVIERSTVPDAEADRFADRAVHRTVRLRVRDAQADDLQEAMLAAGGHCAVSGLAGVEGRVEVLLAGTREQYGRLLDELDARDQGLSHVASQVRRVIDADESADAPDYPWEEGTAVMGILNVTPDSFHDGGEYVDHDDAVRRAKEMVADGADIVDVGGESTRPGADPVSPEDERDRVVPVVEALQDLDAMVSVDTRHASVAEAALDAGADLVNDVTGLEDPAMRHVVAAADVPVVVMHSVDAPVNPDRTVAYDDVVADVLDELTERLLLAERAGIDRENVVVDPGLGFGKQATESFALLDRLDEFRALGCPVMVGHSHKSMFDHVGADHGERLPPTIAATALATERGADVVRAHDVAENVAAVRTAEATSREP